jgi:hypothetical protein
VEFNVIIPEEVKPLLEPIAAVGAAAVGVGVGPGVGGAGQAFTGKHPSLTKEKKSILKDKVKAKMAEHDLNLIYTYTRNRRQQVVNPTTAAAAKDLATRKGKSKPTATAKPHQTAKEGAGSTPVATTTSASGGLFSSIANSMRSFVGMDAADANEGGSAAQETPGPPPVAVRRSKEIIGEPTRDQSTGELIYIRSAAGNWDDTKRMLKVESVKQTGAMNGSIYVYDGFLAFGADGEAGEAERQVSERPPSPGLNVALLVYTYRWWNVAQESEMMFDCAAVQVCHFQTSLRHSYFQYPRDPRGVGTRVNVLWEGALFSAEIKRPERNLDLQYNVLYDEDQQEGFHLTVAEHKLDILSPSDEEGGQVDTINERGGGNVNDVDAGVDGSDDAEELKAALALSMQTDPDNDVATEAGALGKDQKEKQESRRSRRNVSKPGTTIGDKSTLSPTLDQPDVDTFAEGPTSASEEDERMVDVGVPEDGSEDGDNGNMNHPIKHATGRSQKNNTKTRTFGGQSMEVDEAEDPADEDEELEGDVPEPRRRTRSKAGRKEVKRAGKNAKGRGGRPVPTGAEDAGPSIGPATRRGAAATAAESRRESSRRGNGAVGEKSTSGGSNGRSGGRSTRGRSGVDSGPGVADAVSAASAAQHASRSDRPKGNGGGPPAPQTDLSPFVECRMHSGVNDALHVAARKVVLFFFVEDVSGWQASGTAKFLWPMVLRKNIALLLFTEGMREMTQNEPILVSVKGLRLSALAVERLTNVGQILPIKFRKAVHAAVKELVVRLLDEQDGDWIHAMPLLNWLEDCDESIDRKHLEIACYNFGKAISNSSCNQHPEHLRAWAAQVKVELDVAGEFDGLSLFSADLDLAAHLFQAVPLGAELLGGDNTALDDLMPQYIYPSGSFSCVFAVDAVSRAVHFLLDTDGSPKQEILQATLAHVQRVIALVRKASDLDRLCKDDSPLHQGYALIDHVLNSQRSALSCKDRLKVFGLVQELLTSFKPDGRSSEATTARLTRYLQTIARNPAQLQRENLCSTFEVYSSVALKAQQHSPHAQVTAAVFDDWLSNEKSLTVLGTVLQHAGQTDACGDQNPGCLPSGRLASKVEDRALAIIREKLANWKQDPRPAQDAIRQVEEWSDATCSVAKKACLSALLLLGSQWTAYDQTTVYSNWFTLALKTVIDQPILLHFLEHCETLKAFLNQNADGRIEQVRELVLSLDTRLGTEELTSEDLILVGQEQSGAAQGLNHVVKTKMLAVCCSVAAVNAAEKAFTECNNVRRGFDLRFAQTTVLATMCKKAQLIDVNETLAHTLSADFDVWPVKDLRLVPPAESTAQPKKRAKTKAPSTERSDPFDLPTVCDQVLPMLHILWDVPAFEQLWLQCAQAKRGVDLSQVVCMFWSAHDLWAAKLKEFSSETISFEEAEEFLWLGRQQGQTLMEQNDMVALFTLMSRTKTETVHPEEPAPLPWAINCALQMVRYRDLPVIKDRAAAIIAVSEVLKIKLLDDECLKHVRDVATAKFGGGLQLKTITPVLLQLLTMLKERIGDEQVNSLQCVGAVHSDDANSSLIVFLDQDAMRMKDAFDRFCQVVRPYTADNTELDTSLTRLIKVQSGLNGLLNLTTTRENRLVGVPSGGGAAATVVNAPKRGRKKASGKGKKASGKGKKGAAAAAAADAAVATAAAAAAAVSKVEEPGASIEQLLRSCCKIQETNEMEMLDCFKNLSRLRSLLEKSDGSIGENSQKTLGEVLTEGVFTIELPEAANISLDVEKMVSCLVKSREDEPVNSFSSLRELQSKMTLLVSVTNHNRVDELGGFLDCCEKVAIKLMQLRESGHRDFLGRICSEHQPANDDALAVLKDMDKTLGEQLQRWQDELIKIRQQNRFLNYFTIVQLRKMVQAARNVCQKTQPHFAEQLLMCLHPRVSDDDAVKCAEIKGRAAGAAAWDQSKESLENLGELLQEVYQFHLKKNLRVQPVPIAEPLGVAVYPSSHANVVQGDGQRTALTLSKNASSVPNFGNTLVCTPRTTEEAVTNFILRAQTGDGLFCMIHVDQLRDILQPIVIAAAHNAHEKKGFKQNRFRLAIIGQKETRIISSLDRFKVKTQFKPAKDDVLKKFLVQHCLSRPSSSASNVDRVKVVLSERQSGLGKSAFIEHEHRLLDQGAGGCEYMYVSLNGNMDDISFGPQLPIRLPTRENGKMLLHVNLAPDLTEAEDGVLGSDLFSLLVLHVLPVIGGDVRTLAVNDVVRVEVANSPWGRANATRDWELFHLLPKLEIPSPNEVVENAGSFAEIPYTLLDTITVDINDLSLQHTAAFKESLAFKKALSYLSLMPMEDGWVESQRLRCRLDNAVMDGVGLPEPLECVKLLVDWCGVDDPSWITLTSFWKYLAYHFKGLETSALGTVQGARRIHLNQQGFKTSMCRFFAKCARDYSVTQKKIDLQGEMDDDEEPQIVAWEDGAHPFILISPPSVEQDVGSFVFFGFNLDDEAMMRLDGPEVWCTQAYEKPSVPLPEDICEVIDEKKRVGDQMYFVILDKEDGAGAKRVKVDMSIENFGEDQIGKVSMPNTGKGEALCHTQLLKEMKKCDTCPEDEPCAHKFKFDEKYYDWTQEQFLQKLQLAAGIPLDAQNPDPKYVLTVDSTKKILSLLVRLNVGLPSIVMGSTGCGKTSMVHFIARLLNQGRLLADLEQDNKFFAIRADGGTSTDDIEAVVSRAIMSAENLKDQIAARTPGVPMAILLFIDECNACNCMGLIEDIVCKGRLGSKVLTDLPLRIVAACNPFQRMSQEAIDRVESAGLGMSYKQKKGEQKHESKTAIAGTPMRHLVYRVNPIPRSMSQYLFDFGQLTLGVERAYIRKIVEEQVTSWQTDAAPENDGSSASAPMTIDDDETGSSSVPKLPANERQMLIDDFTDVLFQSQKHMRTLENEFSFVSLRDVKRALKIFWFFVELDSPLRAEEARLRTKNQMEHQLITDRYHASMVTAVGLAYRARLTDRTAFDILLALVLNLPADEQPIQSHIECVQQIFARNLTIGPRIALNAALTENAFTLIICMQLGIPLTLVGKPGSSKSLSKTVVQDTMKGADGENEFFKTHFKKIEYFPYLCSQHSTSKAITDAHAQAKRSQKEFDSKSKESGSKTNYVAVLVLDEVGLAEDSVHMPLKVLHRLLDDEEVGFFGISNWSLDPAKMNRGLFLSRAAPEQRELVNTARAIATNNNEESSMTMMLAPIATAYQKVYDDLQPPSRPDFFGLRDFYFVLKELRALRDQFDREITRVDVDWVVRRNFGGVTNVEEIVETFQNCLGLMEVDASLAPPTALHLIKDSLESAISDDGRFLLLMTEGESGIVKDLLFERDILKREDTTVIAGSMFAGDSVFTNTCRDVHRVKTCMETGRTVVLLFCDHIFECLYDLLNKYWTLYRGQRFVELGLGQERGKCKVDPKFRLIVVEKKDHVLKEYAIPLLNRFQKQSVSLEAVLTKEEQTHVKSIKMWVSKKFPADNSASLVGFTTECIAALVMSLGNEEVSRLQSEAAESQDAAMIARDEDQQSEWHDLVNWDAVNTKAKTAIFDAASADAVIRIMYDQNGDNECQELANEYFERRLNSVDYLVKIVKTIMEPPPNIKKHQAIVTTFSPLQTPENVREQFKELNLNQPDELCIFTLHEYTTQQHFVRDCKTVFKNHKSKALVFLCDTRRCQRISQTNNGAAFITYAKWVLQDLIPDDGFPILWIINCYRGDELSELKFTPSQDLKVSHIDSYDAAHADDALHGMALASMRRTPMSDLLQQGGRAYLQNMLQEVLPAAVTRLRHKAAACGSQSHRERSDAIRTFFGEELGHRSDDDNTFARVIGAQVLTLIKKRETSMPGKGSRWLYALVKEADSLTVTSSANKLNRLFLSGTVSAAANRHICKWITNALAILLAAADRNNGVDVLSKAVQGDELYLFALGMFKENVFEGDCAVGRNAVVEVLIDAADGNDFFSSLPFSWVVHRWACQLKKPVMGETTSLHQVEKFNSSMTNTHSPMAMIASSTELRERYAKDLLVMLHSPVVAGNVYSMERKNATARANELRLVLRVLFSEAILLRPGTAADSPNLGCIYVALWDLNFFPRAIERVSTILRADRDQYMQDLLHNADGYGDKALCRLIFRKIRTFWAETTRAIRGTQMESLRFWFHQIDAVRPVVMLLEMTGNRRYEWDAYNSLQMFVQSVHRDIWNGTSSVIPNRLPALLADLKKVAAILLPASEEAPQEPECIVKLHKVVEALAQKEMDLQKEYARIASDAFECYVCLEFVDKATYWAFPCRHVVHEHCAAMNGPAQCGYCRAEGVPAEDALVTRSYKNLLSFKKNLSRYFADVLEKIALIKDDAGNVDIAKTEPTLRLMSNVVTLDTKSEVGMLETDQHRQAALRLLVGCARQNRTLNATAAPMLAVEEGELSPIVEELEQNLLKDNWLTRCPAVGLMYATVHEDLLLYQSICRVDDQTNRTDADHRQAALIALDALPFSAIAREQASALEKVRFVAVVRFAITQMIPHLIKLGADWGDDHLNKNPFMAGLIIRIENICVLDNTIFSELCKDFIIKQVARGHSLGVLQTLSQHIETAQTDHFSWLPNRIEAMSESTPDIFAAVSGYAAANKALTSGGTDAEYRATILVVEAVLPEIVKDDDDEWLSSGTALSLPAIMLMSAASYAMAVGEMEAIVQIFPMYNPGDKLAGAPMMTMIMGALRDASFLTDRMPNRPEIGPIGSAVVEIKNGNENGGRLADMQVAGLVAMLGGVLLANPNIGALPAVLRPLREVLDTPAQFTAEAFLPGMPAPVVLDLDEIKRNTGATEVRKCTNGHIYTVGNCGEQTYTERSICKHDGCDVGIGGGQGILVTGGGKLVQEANRGFYLATPQDDAPTLREMPPTAVAAMRCMNDLVCLAAVAWSTPGHESDLRPLCGATFPAGTPLADHFVTHLKGDLEALGKAIHGSTDDAVVFMQLLLNDVNKPYAGGGGGGGPAAAAAAAAGGGVGIFMSEQARDQWEQMLLASGLQQLVSDREERLRVAKEIASKDKNCSKLVRVVQELVPAREFAYIKDDYEPGDEHLADLWRYRISVTAPHFWDMLRVARDKAPDELRLLGLIAEYADLLVGVRCLPRVIRLQQKLVTQLDRRHWADRKYCEETTIGHHIAKMRAFGNGEKDVDGRDFPQDFPQVTELEEKVWLDDVEAMRVAYGVIRERMNKFVMARYRGDAKTAPVVLGADAMLAFFLPSSAAGKGMLSVAVSLGLASINNEFLSKAFKCFKEVETMDEFDGDDAMDTKEEPILSNGGTIAVSSVQQSNIAGLDEYADLLPVVLKNSTIPLKYGSGSSVDYDFGEIEFQLKELLVDSSRMIDEQSVEAAKRFTYSTDLCNNESFAAVRKFIPQMIPEGQELTALVETLISVNRLHEAVETLEAGISFLAASETEMDVHMPLRTYLIEVLQYTGELIEHLPEAIMLQHVLAVWQRCELEVALLTVRAAKKAHVQVQAEATTDEDDDAEDRGPDVILMEDAPDEAPADFKIPTFPALTSDYLKPLNEDQQEIISTRSLRMPRDSKMVLLAELLEYLLVGPSSADYREKNREFPGTPGCFIPLLNLLIEDKQAADDMEDCGLADVGWLNEGVLDDDQDPPTIAQAAAVWWCIAHGLD